MIEVRLLGPVRAVVDGEVIAVGGTKQRAVLALLALGMPRAVTTASIIDAVWGEHAPASARNAVQVYVSGLRKVLPDGVAIERDGDGYRIHGRDLTVDSAEFERRVSAGRSALRAGDTARASDLLRTALSMWAGEPLGGLEDLPIHGTATQTLKDTRALAQVEQAESLLRSGEFEEVVRAAQELTRERPYEERAWGLLASAHYHAGRQSEALAACREVRRLLASELGVDPSPALADIEAAILGQRLESPAPDVTSGVPATGTPEPPALPPLPDPLVGRQGLIDDVAARVAGGRLVSLVGLGGIGKTTIATAVAHVLRQGGRAAVFCELEAETSPVTALERICRTLGVDPGEDPVAALAQVEPGTVVVLDNVEQIPGFGPVVSEVVKGTRLTILATTRRALHLRDEDIVQVAPLSLVAEGGIASPAVELFLSRVERVRGGFDRAAALSAGHRVCKALDGIPLAIEIVAARSRLLTIEQLADRLASGVDSSLDGSRGADVPARQVSLATIIGSALDTQSVAARRALDWLTCLEGWTTIELLQAVVETGGGADDLVDAVEDLVDAGLAEHDHTGRVRVRTPVRELVRQRCAPYRDEMDRHVVTCAAELTAAVAPVLDGPAAADGLARLERDHDPLVGALGRAVEGALHAEVAQLVTALQRYWLMGDRVPEGLRWIEAGLALESLSVEERCRLDILNGTFASYLGQDRVGAILQPALVQASALGLAVDRPIVNGWCCLAAWHAQRGETDSAGAAAGRAMDVAEQSGQRDLVSLANDLAGYVASHSGDYAAALDAHLLAATEARRSGQAHALIGVLSSLVDDFVGLGRFDEAIGVADEAFDLVGSWSSLSLRGMVLTTRGLALTCSARVAEAEGCLVEALRIGRDHLPDPFGQGDRLALLAIGAALHRDDVRSGRLWGAARALYADVGTSAGARLPSAIVDEVAAAAERGGPAFVTAETVGSLSPDRVIEDLVATRAWTGPPSRVGTEGQDKSG